LHFRLLLFKPTHNGHERTLVQAPCKCVQLLRCAHRIGFHAAIVKIPDPPRHADGPGLGLHEGAETDALDPARNQPAPRRLLSGRTPSQWTCSGASSGSAITGAASIAFLTAAHKLCS
jgi:hypothetical protein